jgi:protein EFR3
MCHGSDDNLELRSNIRMAGIRGLQGVIRKTVSDDLVENIWERQHMEKIVPSLLFNMQSSVADAGKAEENEEQPSTPPILAESVLRELVSRASFGHIKDVLKPLLNHLDHHQLWYPYEFAIHTFKIVMLSIQPQYSYTVVETLMSHLDQTTSSKTKTSLAVVLTKIIAIAAGESVGPSALDIINNLLTLLRDSVSSKNPTIGLYQENLINALGQFANHHPDYQKIEIMLFIMNKVPSLSKKDQVDQLLQIILLKSLLKVSVQYRTQTFDKAFPASFLQPLLKMAKVPLVETRITVMEILQALLDRHKNQTILSVVTIKNYPGISLEPPNRSDIIFANKQVGNLMAALIKSMVQDDAVNALESAYTTAALMIAEMGCIETLQEFLVFIFHLQDTAIRSEELTVRHKCNLHRIVIALTVFLSRSVGVYTDYCEQLIDKRRQEAPYLLPPLTEDNSPTLHAMNLEIPEDLLLDRPALVACLQSAGIRSERLQMETLFPSDRRVSLIDGMTSRDGNMSDTYPDIDSIKSSPDVSRVSY